MPICKYDNFYVLTFVVPKVFLKLKNLLSFSSKRFILLFPVNIVKTRFKYLFRIYIIIINKNLSRVLHTHLNYRKFDSFWSYKDTLLLFCYNNNIVFRISNKQSLISNSLNWSNLKLFSKLKIDLFPVPIEKKTYPNFAIYKESMLHGVKPCNNFSPYQLFIGLSSLYVKTLEYNFFNFENYIKKLVTKVPYIHRNLFF